MTAAEYREQEGIEFVFTAKNKSGRRTDIDIDDVMEQYAKQEKIKLLKNIERYLQSKHDVFLGTQGQEARDAFKNGLDWSIDTIKVKIRELKTLKDG